MAPPPEPEPVRPVAVPEPEPVLAAAAMAPEPPRAAVPPLEPYRMPDFLGTSKSPPLSTRQIIIGSTAGAVLGILLVALWIIAR